MKIRSIVGALAICLGLTGCPCQSVNPYGKIIRTETTGPTGMTEVTTIEGGVTATCATRGLMQMMNAAGAVNAADIAVDISTYNSVVLDGSGTGTLTITEGGTVLGSTSFGYVVLDSMAVAANPAAVNTWLANYPSADGFDVALNGVQTVDVAPGPAAMTAEILYGTTVVSTASSSWTSGGSGCVGNPGGGGDTFPEMPIVDDPGTGCIP